MLQIVDVGTYICAGVRNNTKIGFCIEDVNDDDISAYVSVFLHYCDTDGCNCRSTTNELQDKVFNTELVIPMQSFQSVGDGAVAYATEYSNTADNNDEYDYDIVFDLKGFMEATQVLNLPELTTRMLAESSPKLLVYDYIISLINSRICWKRANEDNYTEPYLIDELKHKYSWILTDEEFDEEKLRLLNKSFRISLVQMIQDVENAYNELYGILSDYENPRGLLK